MHSIGSLQTFISHLASHVTKLDKACQLIDIEPVFLAYFSSYTRTNISKDALSKVSKTFFKELKMHYRKLGDNGFVEVLTSLSSFYMGHESQTVGSFWQFMVAITCERITDEHAHFVFTILKDRSFTEQA